MTALAFAAGLLGRCDTAAGNDLQRFQYTEVHMGMQARIVLYAPSESAALEAARAAFRRIGSLDAALSDYRPTSELMRLCARAGEGPVRVSGDLMRVLRRSLELARRTDGAFDPTCGPVVELWRRARREGRLPSTEAVREALGRTGWTRVTLYPERSAVSLSSRGMKLDLGGIAKGYACDAALRELLRCGTPRALVEIGGDLVVGSAPPGRAGWSIVIPSARRQDDLYLCLTDAAVSTSGDTEQYVEIDGKRYSHIVDPRTGIGLTTRVAVSVIARRGEISDGLSTAISVLGAVRGRALAARYPEVQVYIRSQTD
ncbi:MAG: FAD:protein FMN transferase [Chthonomonadales bacterium]|nr:FAD:protein FMN transferase [Chthonomonadales bacterium]